MKQKKKKKLLNNKNYIHAYLKIFHNTIKISYNFWKRRYLKNFLDLNLIFMVFSVRSLLFMQIDYTNVFSFSKVKITLINFLWRRERIRTLDGLSPMPVFKTGAFNRSAISPYLWIKIYLKISQYYKKRKL